jgi:hypothetical protein
MLRHIWFVLSVMLPMLPMLPTSLAAQAPTTESLGRSLHEFIERGMGWRCGG